MNNDYAAFSLVIWLALICRLNWIFSYQLILGSNAKESSHFCGCCWIIGGGQCYWMYYKKFKVMTPASLSFIPWKNMRTMRHLHPNFILGIRKECILFWTSEFYRQLLIFKPSIDKSIRTIGCQNFIFFSFSLLTYFASLLIADKNIPSLVVIPVLVFSH